MFKKSKIATKSTGPKQPEGVDKSNCRPTKVARSKTLMSNATTIKPIKKQVADRRGISEIRRSESCLKAQVISLNDDKVELNRHITEQIKLSEEKDEIIVQLKEEMELYKKELENERNRNREIIENLQRANIDPVTFGKNIEDVNIKHFTANVKNSVEKLCEELLFLEKNFDEFL